MSGKVVKGSSGFTLVEMAIVLVIIGLILGAILKGQEMIKNAKIKRLKTDIDSIVAAAYSYQDRYGFLPGDDPNANARFGNGCVGNGDGIISNTSKSRDEYVCFWKDLVDAGFISGSDSGTTEADVAKKDPFGTYYMIRYGTVNGKTGSGKTGQYIEATNIPLDVIESLDIKYDDGEYNSGDVQSNRDYATSNYPYANLYWFAF